MADQIGRRTRADLLDEWGRVVTLVDDAENNPDTSPPDLVVLWRQLCGLACELRSQEQSRISRIAVLDHQEPTSGNLVA